jgi:single-stranded-DNA-specific exonuclease
MAAPGAPLPKEVPPEAVLAWSRELGVTRTAASWLLARGHGDIARARDFLDPKLKDLTPPDQMADRDRAASRIASAIRRGEHVVVFGDYDCDGITAAAIVTETIEALGGRATPLLASRFDGGYGVSRAATARILAERPALLVTCDCGSSDHETLGALTERGIDVVVIDHHLVPDRPLPVVAFLNPHRPECRFPYKGLSSCGLALSIAAALRKELGTGLDLKRWLDLVAIGTIADVAPLDGDNRALVRAGLRALTSPLRPGLRALLSMAKVSPEAPVTARDVSFRIAPHLNSPGRLGAPDLALELLLAKDEARASELAAAIERVSSERRELQNAMTDEACAEIDAKGYANDAALVLGREGWNPGVVGIVAGRLSERFQKPVIVVGFENGIGRGSVRGPKGASLHSALVLVQDCLLRFGGHQAAAGLEVADSRLDELRRRFAAVIASAPGDSGPVDVNVVSLLPGDRPLALLEDLDRLEPCGPDNPRPRVEVRGQVLRAREVKGGHLKVDLDLGAAGTLGGFFIGQGSRAEALSGAITVVGDLRHTAFPGSGGVELFGEALG